MKTILTALALVATLGCGVNHTHRVSGWAEKAAQQWAASLGKPNAPVVCNSYTYLNGGDKSADCSVSIGDRVYRLYCWVDNYSDLCEQR